MRTSGRFLAMSAIVLGALALSGCSCCDSGRRPLLYVPPIYPKSTLSAAAPSSCCGVDPHGSPAGFLATHFSPYAWREFVGRDAASRGDFYLPVALGAGALLARAFDTGLESAAKDAFGGNQIVGDLGNEGLVAASLAVGILHPREGRTVRDELWTQGEAFALTFGLTEGFKHLVRRQRPDVSDLLSFPSGHTSMSFCAATLIACDAGPALGIPAYGVAFLTAFSRVESGKHFVSDVLAGAALGTAVAIAVDALHFGNGSHGSGICGCADGPTLGCGTCDDGRPAIWLSFKF
jgi:membrane-associated phospholipid phosphatase